MTNQTPERRTALAFLAHPDDAEILCAGTLIRLARAGWDVHIATATAGDCGSASLPPEEIARIRRSEAATAAELIGAAYHCLDERDVNVMFDAATNRKAIDLLRRIAPSVVFTHPRRDYMLDHEQVHLLARSATFSYSIPNASDLPRPPGSIVPWLYYCDPLDGCDPYTGELVVPSAYVDISSTLPLKTQMLACHASQREWLRQHHGMDEYIDSMVRHAARRGQERGVASAEGFVQHRGHAYPASNLLAELWGDC